jgi:hypothetical protein
MTINEQKEILRGHVLAFLEHQRQATIALRAINEIGLLENEGNPFESAIQGEDSLRNLSAKRIGRNGDYSSPVFESGEFMEVIEDAKQAIEANGYIV